MAALWEEEVDAIDTAEVHWSTGTILALFFASSLISAVFFGLGYSLGRGGTAKPIVAMASSSAEPAAGLANLGPAAFADRANPLSALASSAESVAPAKTVDSGRADKNLQHAPMRREESAAAKLAAVTHPKPPRIVPGKGAKKTAAKVASGTHYMVQVGAIGDHKDAQVLVSELRRKGYHAGVYVTKRDKFLHVQIGPFSNAEQAQSMRHRVRASGFHAILKQVS